MYTYNENRIGKNMQIEEKATVDNGGEQILVLLSGRTRNKLHHRRISWLFAQGLTAI